MYPKAAVGVSMLVPSIIHANSNLAKMQNPLAIPSFVEFSTLKSPTRFHEDPEFDAQRQTLVAAGIFADGLSFPHDVDVSADGRFAAIANYGDDSLRIARVTPST
jgi:hypothetical protein